MTIPDTPGRLNRRSAMAAMTTATLAGCGSSNPNPRVPAADEPLVVQLNWFPEAEHGGVYQAQAEGRYRRNGLTVDIRPGGTDTPIGAELQLGRCHFAIVNADDVVQFRRAGVDAVAVAAVVQNSPRCILVREDAPAETINDLAGMTLQCQPGRAFVRWMRHEGLLDDVRTVPYLGTVAPLATDPRMAIQAYRFSEPFQAEQAEIPVRWMMVSETGWNPYSSVLVTTGELIRERPEDVTRFTAATLEGWRSYLVDPSSGNEKILAANRHGLTADALQYGHQPLRKLAYPDGAKPESLGTLNPDRWRTLVEQMDTIDPDQAGKVDASDCFLVDDAAAGTAA